MLALVVLNDHRLYSMFHTPNYGPFESPAYTHLLPAETCANESTHGSF